MYKRRVQRRVDQYLELEHQPRARLRVGCCPGRLRCECGLYRLVEHRRITKIDLALDTAIIGVAYIALAGRCFGSS